MSQGTSIIEDMEREVEEAITESHQTIVDTDHIVSASKEQMHGLLTSPLLTHKSGGNTPVSNRSFEAFICVDVEGTRSIITATVKETINCLTTFRENLEKILLKENSDFPGLDTATFYDPIVRKWLPLEEGITLPHKAQIFCTPRDKSSHNIVISNNNNNGYHGNNEGNAISNLSLGTPLPNLQATSTTLGGSVKLTSPMYRLADRRATSGSDELISTLNTADMRTPSPESKLRHQHLFSLTDVTDRLSSSNLHIPLEDDDMNPAPLSNRSESPACNEDKVRLEYYLSVIERQRSYILELEATVQSLKNKNKILTNTAVGVDPSVSVAEVRTPEILKQRSPIPVSVSPNDANRSKKIASSPEALHCRLRTQNTRNVTSNVPFLYKKRILTIENWRDPMPKITINCNKDGFLRPLETVSPIRFAIFNNERTAVNISFIISTVVSTWVFVADDKAIFTSWMDFMNSTGSINTKTCTGILPSPEVGFVPSPR
eukprot:TRINITY_DN14023_c0_g1_i1.p1 TRINITY_DN14023_c0_g1~~TRINITY_DN14023_c0_g1_i1.p1  ORF type:complete len:489 (+),score=50.25 TRINITY_DN14023_c0_g1_i1:71-1537(+)